MDHLIHRAPSVGSVLNKIMAINPDLSAPEMIALIKRSVRAQGGASGDFAATEVIDEEKALSLARATVTVSDRRRHATPGAPARA